MSQKIGKQELLPLANITFFLIKEATFMTCHKRKEALSLELSRRSYINKPLES